MEGREKRHRASRNRTLSKKTHILIQKYFISDHFPLLARPHTPSKYTLLPFISAPHVVHTELKKGTHTHLNKFHFRPHPSVPKPHIPKATTHLALNSTLQERPSQRLLHEQSSCGCFHSDVVSCCARARPHFQRVVADRLILRRVTCPSSSQNNVSHAY